MKRISLFVTVVLIFLFNAFLYAQQNKLVSPEEFLGFKIGADFKLARWEQIIEYFNIVDDFSERVVVRELGKSTEGEPFIMAVISDPQTIKDREKYKNIQSKLADPRGLNEDEEKRLVEEGKVVVLVSCNIHSTEIASTQMAMELLYQLAVDNDPKTKEILDNDIILLVPSVNPDGVNKIVDWYIKSLGTPWEGGSMPWLYQKYVGHDNNRDWYMLTQAETRILTKMLYTEWFPEIVYDIHQMGNKSVRYFVPPFFDPVNPNVDPLIHESLKLLGGHIVTDLSAAGKTGVLTNAMYDNWWHGGNRTTPYRHNMFGLLTEAASVRIASPIFQKKSELGGVRRGLADQEPKVNYAEPWPGGWWRLRDIVEYEEITCYSIFTVAARYRDMFLRNYLELAKGAVEKGKTEPPFAYLVPENQKDLPTALRMLEILQLGGIEIQRANAGFTADDVSYPSGTYVILLAQPYRNHAKDLMESQKYPQRYLYPGGPAEPPYDMAGWTLPFQMGVKRISVVSGFKADLSIIDKIPHPKGKINNVSSQGYILKNKMNNDFILINRFLSKRGVEFRIAKKGFRLSGEKFDAGAVIVKFSDNNTRNSFEKTAVFLGCELYGSSAKPDVDTYRIAGQRTALYQSWTANMDEGWSRWVLEQFEFPFKSLHDAEVRAGDLRDRYDVIILPSQSESSIVGGVGEFDMPPQYTGGMTELGVRNLLEFVEQGGMLVCIDGSCMFAINRFNLPIKNIVSGVLTKSFYCPGSVLGIELNINHPIAYGMNKNSAGYFRRSAAFSIEEDEEGDDEILTTSKNSEVIAKYSDKVLLLSGWIIGEEKIKGQPAIVETEFGEGKIILFGFRVQNRGQPHGTFRLLFNSIYYGSMK